MGVPEVRYYTLFLDVFPKSYIVDNIIFYRKGAIVPYCTTHLYLIYVLYSSLLYLHIYRMFKRLYKRWFTDSSKLLQAL